jgi:hypothetical protein
MSAQSKYRQDLPQLKEDEKPFLVDGGLETHLVYHQGNFCGIFWFPGRQFYKKGL